jgi:Reverse transcriptase (RNA-dependent DNA polymerase)
MSEGMASEEQSPTLSSAVDNPPQCGPKDEAVADTGEVIDSVTVKVMERVVERDNLHRALNQVRRNKGGPGIDGLTVERLADYVKQHWPGIRTQLLNGTYRPAALKRVLIAKPGGGVRSLGIPTVVDRFIQQALLQVLQPQWDHTFSHSSFGFRPKRSAHQARCTSTSLRSRRISLGGGPGSGEVLRHGESRRADAQGDKPSEGRSGYRRLRVLGIERELAWNTAKSAHGPWRLSKSPALHYAMDAQYFTTLGLPTLAGS